MTFRRIVATTTHTHGALDARKCQITYCSNWYVRQEQQSPGVGNIGSNVPPGMKWMRTPSLTISEQKKEIENEKEWNRSECEVIGVAISL